MSRSRSFRTTIFYAILGVALVPLGLTLFGGVLVLQEFGTSTGTLGPWDAVAESGRTLIDASRDPASDSLTIEIAAAEHEAALSESVRRSRVYALVTQRIGRLLPFVALSLLLVLGGLAMFAARQLSKRLGNPVHELVEWSERIVRGEPLPPAEVVASGAKEFRVLRRAMGAMEGQLSDARSREVESARMRAWTEMARRVAHELKNPLTPIRMSASALARSDDPSIRSSAELILEEAARLDEMARTFSQFGKAPEGPMAEVDVIELLAGTVRTYAGSEAEVSLVTPQELPHVMGHHDALGRAVSNLIVNALEAGDQDARVRVVARQENDSVLIRVEDNGPGIPEDMVDVIWLPEVTTRRRGTGLGLAIVRQTVAAHGGSVLAENLPDRGAVFTIHIPIRGDEA